MIASFQRAIVCFAREGAKRGDEMHDPAASRYYVGMLRNTADSWGAPAKFFHWVMAALILAQIALGVTAANWRVSPMKLELFFWHKSTGMLILLLVALRLLWRLANPAPELPSGMPAWERAAARASHLLLYVLMIALPIAGWIVNSASNVPFRIFWLIPLPAIVAPDQYTADLAALVHRGLAALLALVLAAHIGAALRHHFVKRNTVLIRMLPGAWRTP
jgi:cytochrome b561